MEAVGNEVLLALAFPILAITTLIFLKWKSIKNICSNLFRSDVRIQENQEERHHREHIIGDNTCSICLNNPKIHTVSATCGHSFCGECLFDIYRANKIKLKCPLCRQEITTIFKIFGEAEPEEEVNKIIEQIRDYNRLFDDNRPLLRRITELPYVLRRIRMFVFRPDFVVYFLRSVQIFRLLFLCILYILIPLDIIPEKMLGWFGFIDDILVIILLLVFFIMIAALQYMRHRGY